MMADTMLKYIVVEGEAFIQPESLAEYLREIALSVEYDPENPEQILRGLANYLDYELFRVDRGDMGNVEGGGI
jgi:predicted transcriptional regulator with HTH domain